VEHPFFSKKNNGNKKKKRKKKGMWQVWQTFKERYKQSVKNMKKKKKITNFKIATSSSK
jgi:hypothetical protein